MQIATGPKAANSPRLGSAEMPKRDGIKLGQNFVSYIDHICSCIDDIIYLKLDNIVVLNYMIIVTATLSTWSTLTFNKWGLRLFQRNDDDVIVAIIGP